MRTSWGRITAFFAIATAATYSVAYFLNSFRGGGKPSMSESAATANLLMLVPRSRGHPFRHPRCEESLAIYPRPELETEPMVARRVDSAGGDGSRDDRDEAACTRCPSVDTQNRPVVDTSKPAS